MPRRAYPSDATDEEWLFVSPYLTLMREDAPQREDDLARSSTATSAKTAAL
jgi:hypothetical protein